ncbi:histone acetyltransferases subunit 3-domain-containing protein [Hysterangium stoloniferum]|nr:histone acetyltransferases subunit 3-domain-containing protein [Hysterangium stoloniferum]
MTQLLPPYPTVSAVRSQLLTNPPSSVPPIDDLLSLQEELKALYTKSLGRARKAENDIKTLDGLYRKYKDKDRERDKGKMKEKIKIKRETTETPDSNGPSAPISTPSSAAAGGYGDKKLPGSVISKAASSKMTPGMKKFTSAAEQKKKKRKREEDDSEMEEVLDRHKKQKRSPEPLAAQHKQKNPTKVASHPSSGLHTPQATPLASWGVPRHVSHVPPRPTSGPLPVPGPSSPRQVIDDFSKLKTPAQTAISTFWTYMEPWLRPIREEDVGLLEWDGDEETPFVIPPLGRHYTEIWEDEDNGRYVSLTGSPDLTPSTASLPRWDPLTLQDSDLTSHEKGHTLGPVHERLLSAMLPVPLLADGKPAAGGNVKPSVNGESRVLNASLVNVQDMQDRLMKELRSIGLLGDEDPDYTKSPDDPLAAELRQCQRELRTQIAVNKARRQRLSEIAKARLARNEFEEHEAALERSILSKYNQLQRRDMPKPPKKKKKSGGAGGGAHVVPDGPFVPPPHIHSAAWGLEVGEDGELGVDEELNNMIVTRQKFVGLVKPCLDVKERERPGTLYGSPKESIYKDVKMSEPKAKLKRG